MRIPVNPNAQRHMHAGRATRVWHTACTHTPGHMQQTLQPTPPPGGARQRGWCCRGMRQGGLHVVIAMRGAGVHEAATLRAVAEAAGAGAPVRATARATHDADSGVTAPSTLVGFIEWESGLLTGLSVTLTAAFVRPRPTLSIVTRFQLVVLLYNTAAAMMQCPVTLGAA